MTIPGPDSGEAAVLYRVKSKSQPGYDPESAKPMKKSETEFYAVSIMQTPEPNEGRVRRLSH